MNEITNVETPLVNSLSDAVDDRFRLLVESVQDYGIIMLDPAGNIFSWNPGAEKNNGYKSAEVVGRHFSCLYTPEDIVTGEPQRGLQIALAEGRFEEEAIRLRKGGIPFWAIVTITKIEDSAGRHLGFANVTRDITERKQAQEKLHERAILATLSADVGLAFIRGGALRETLQACAESMALNLGAAFARIWTLNEADQVLELQASAGMYTHLDGAHSRVPVGKFKIGLIAQDKKPHLTNDVAHNPLISDPDWAEREGMFAFAGYPLLVEDRLVGVMAMFARNRLSDTTFAAMASIANHIALGIERVTKDEAQRRSEERYRGLIESIPVLMWVYDASGGPLLHNHRWYDYTGQTREEIAAYHWHKAVHPDDAAGAIAVWDRCKASGEPYAAEYRIRRDDGEYRWFLSQGTAQKGPNGIEQWVGICTDIDDRKRAEEDRRKLVVNLGERIKELRLLHRATALLQDESLEPVMLIGMLVALLPAGWQYPEITAARITWGRHVATSPRFAETPWLQVAGFAAGGLAGKIEVVYLEERPAEAEGPFLMEERELLNSLAEMLPAHLDRRQTAASLQQSEGRLRELTANIDQVLWMIDPKESKALYVSPGYEKLWGRSCQSLLDNPHAYLDAVHPLDRERVRREEATPNRSGHSETEFRIVRPDGSVRWVSAKSYPVMEAGRIVRLVGVVEDITEKRRIADSVTLSETRYRRLFEAAKDGILIVDVSSRQILDVNPFLADLLGYTHEELIGMELWEIGLFRDIEANKAAFTVLQDQGYVRYDDLPLLTKAKRRIEVEFVSNVYEVGDIQVIQCNIRDITDRKRAEDALRLRDRAIQAATQGLVITDPAQPDNPLTYVSPGFERMTGYSSGEVLGRNCRFLQGKDTDSTAAARLHEAILAGVTGSVELLNYRKDGTPFWNELSISPIRDANGRLTHFVGVLADVTQRRRLENQFRQAQKMEAVGQLAGGVAHDFNNLLTVISGYSELLLGMLPSNDPKREAIRAISEAGERAAGLTRQLLSFSRQAVLETKILDVNEVVKDTERMLRRMIGEDILLTSVLDPNVSRIKADSGQIGQVLMNLAINARDAMPKGGKLTIETSDVQLDEAHAALHADCKPGRYVKLAISDNGAGMTSETKAHVFEPFFTTKGPGKGTGLGLATVYGIVKQSDGNISLYSEVGHGTTFKIYFPAIDDPVHLSTSDQRNAKVVGGTETILLVEDEDAVRAIALLALQTQGYTVLHAETGKKAIAIVAKYAGRIDMLVTDVVMPGMSGRELAEAFLPQFPDLKVLYLSGYTDDSVIRHGILQMEVAFLQKPYTPLALARKVREVLDAS